MIFNGSDYLVCHQLKPPFQEFPGVQRLGLQTLSAESSHSTLGQGIKISQAWSHTQNKTETQPEVMKMFSYVYSYKFYNFRC